MAITPELLESIDSFETLASKLFHDELGWPVSKWEVFAGVPKLYGLHPENDIPGVVELAAVQKIEDLDWGIFRVDFGDNPLKRGDLRRILNKVAEKARAQHDNPTWPHDKILFICRSEGNNWTLGYFTGDKLANAKLRTFGWTDAYRARTAITRNLPELHWENRDHWHTAWDAETLTKDFFKDYKQVFDKVEASVVGLEGDDKRKFTQSLFNRLMFLCFLQEKEWLELEGERKDYLFRLHEKFVPAKGEARFYDRLRVLFFSGLNSPNGTGGDRELLEKLIGRVPFLNGGLFQPDTNLDKHDVHVPDEVFKHIFGLFKRYTFTVTESTPMDIEVALDPEMLGKIFEELVTGRHESGSYYTPRPVVSFMCREALKGYLGGYEKLVDEHDAEGIGVDEATRLIQKLEKFRFVDPACGSGAYLVGMLQEVFQLQRILDTTAHKLSDRDDYSRKLTSIQDCLYGVDIDPFAVNIAWLRVWLSLVIERSANPLDEEDYWSEDWRNRYALPNLDLRLAVGDSLLAPSPQGGEQPDIYRSRQIVDYDDLLASYQRAYTKAKKDQLLDQISALEEAIAEWAHPGQPVHGYDWRVKCSRVFAAGGFDAVVMNPPYISANRVPGDKREEFRRYMEQVGSVFGYKQDLYVHFLHRACELLRPGGILAAITSNTYFTNTTKHDLRKYLLERRPKWLIPLSPDVFDADVYSAILVAENTNGSEDDQVGFLNLRHANVESIATAHELSGRALFTSLASYRRAFGKILFEPTKWNSELFDTLLSAKAPVMVDGRRFAPLELVAPALDTGIDTGNVRSKLFYRSQPVGQTFHRLLQGTQVIRYGTWWDSPRARFRYVDVDYVADETRHGVGRGGRPSGRTEYWHFRGPVENHHLAERLLMRQTEDEPFVGYIRQGEEHVYTDNTIHTLLLTKNGLELGFSYPYLLALLNSTTCRRIYQAIVQEEGRALAQVKTTLVNRLPLPIAGDEERARLEQLVREIQEIYERAGLPLSDDAEAQVSEIQDEINARVEFLYFHQSEAPTYDEWLAKQEAEKGTAVEEVRKLLAIGHETTEFECKSSFSWDVKKGEQADWLKDEVHTAICAMLNAKGGDLLIGVDDDMHVLGLTEDLARYGGKDKLVQAIEGPLGKTITPNPIGLVDIMPLDMDGNTIVRIRVKPDHTERYEFKGNIYVRRNSKSKPALTPAEAASWWPKRQRGEV